MSGKIHAPDIKEIIKKEEVLLGFIVDKNTQDFSLGVFKKEYSFYSRDLLDIMEASFLDYLFTFFSDEGMPFIGESLKVGASKFHLYHLIEDFKIALSPPLYKRLLENSFYYAPPYLPLYAFTEKLKRNELKSLTVVEWERVEIKMKFADFFMKNYHEKQVEETLREIQKWIDRKDAERS
jgi:nitrate reductase beta subunit